MNDRDTCDEEGGSADQTRPAPEHQPAVARVRVVGGPLNGNTYAVTSSLDEAVVMESLAGMFVYRRAVADDGEVLLQFVGPAAPVVD